MSTTIGLSRKSKRKVLLIIYNQKERKLFYSEQISPDAALNLYEKARHIFVSSSQDTINTKSKKV
jgi:hypothetical protein